MTAETAAVAAAPVGQAERPRPTWASSAGAADDSPSPSSLEEPGALAGLLTTLLNNNLNAGASSSSSDRRLGRRRIHHLRGSAGQQVAGADTPADFTDDEAAWLTEGDCANADGTTMPCSVDISERAGTRPARTSPWRVVRSSFIPGLEDHHPDPGPVAERHAGRRLPRRLDGVITDADAAEVRFS
ncbi:MAG: hypothetical protein R3F43_32300 [bacterium]